jgi:alanine racemase
VFFDASHSAEKAATNASTISYELITGISQRVKRKIVTT